MMTSDTTLSYAPSATVCPPLRRRTLLVLSALGISIVFFAASGASDLWLSSLWKRFEAGERLTATEVQLSTVSTRVIQVGFPIAMLTTFVFLAMWMHRANRNLRALGCNNLKFTPAATVWWWFCPFMNLVRPYQAMDELFKKSVRVGKPRGFSQVGFWWTFWLLGGVMRQVANVASPSAGGDASDNADIAMWGVVPTPFYVIAGLLLMGLIWRIDRGQDRLRNMSAV